MEARVSFFDKGTGCETFLWSAATVVQLQMAIARDRGVEVYRDEKVS
jgi:hypothetical protein